MAVTQNTYTGNGSTVLYSLSFSYLDENDVKVTVNGTLVTNYIFATASSIQFATAPAAGAAIRIYRDTDTDQTKATFFAGSAVRASDLNANFIQTLYSVQEIAFRALSKIGDTMQGILNMGGFKITNLGAPATDTDAANKQYIDERLGEIGIPGHTRWTKTATAGQTVLSGVGSEGNTLEYSASREQVFVNGALLQRNADYTANDGLTITLLVPLILGDLVDVRCVNNLPTGISGLASDITFLQAGTGATSRSVQNKLRDVVSVKDFGAVGDGVADDTAAIQAAINYVQSFYIPETYASASPGPGVGEVFFPFGYYKITSALTITRSMSFRGEGHSEYSIGPRIVQHTANADAFRVNPIAQGCSVSWDDLTIHDASTGGTTGSFINITKTTATCNSVRIRGCCFGPPGGLMIRIQSSDDVMITGNLFDVSANNVISLGTTTSTDVVSNCQISGNTFYAVNTSGVLAYNVDGLIITNNRVYPAGTNMANFLDGYNTLPYQLKNIILSDNTFKGVKSLALLTGVTGLVIKGNNGVSLGGGAGSTFSCIHLTGTCSGLNISGNVLSGTFDTLNFYNSSGATVSNACIAGNTFINTGGTGQALACAGTGGHIGQNSYSGFAAQSLGEQFYTSGNAISVGVIASLTAVTHTLTVSGAAQGDKVTLTPISLTWPVPAGVEVSAFISAANTVSIRYVNVTGSAIGVGAHDFGILVTR